MKVICSSLALLVLCLAASPVKGQSETSRSFSVMVGGGVFFPSSSYAGFNKDELVSLTIGYDVPIISGVGASARVTTVSYDKRYTVFPADLGGVYTASVDYRQWLIGIAPVYNIPLSDVAIVSPRIGINYAIVSATYHMTDGSEITETDKGLLGMVMGVSFERSFTAASPLSFVLDIEYSALRGKISHAESGDYSGWNTGVGIRYSFK